MNQNAGKRLVFHRQCGSFTVCDGEIGGGAVQLEALRRLNLHGIVVTGIQRRMDAARAVGGNGVHQSAIHFPDLEGGAGDALGGVALGDLNQLQSALGLVEEGQGLGGSLLDKDGLRRGVQHIAAGSSGLLGGDGHAGGQVGDNDAPVFIGDILAIIRSHNRAGAVGDEEGHPLDGVGSAVHILLDGQRLLGRIVKGEGLRVCRVDGDNLRPGGLVNGVAGNRPGFSGHDSAGHAGNADFSVGIGGIETVAGQMAVGVVHIAAASVGQFKFHACQWLLGDGIQLADHQLTRPLIPEGQFGGLGACGDLHGLGGAVQHKALHRLDFPCCN